MKQPLSSAWLLLVGLVLLGCDPEKVPIAGLEIEPSELSLSYPQHQTVEVRLTPHAYPLRGGCPMMFVHLLGQEGEIMRTFDRPVPGWPLGKELKFSLTLFQSALGEPLPAGTYRLVGGLYGPRSGKRFAVQFRGAEAGRFSYEWTQVDVPPPQALGAELQVSPGWEEVEKGEARQILGRRWLHRHGTVGLLGPSTALDLWMLVKVPGNRPDLQLEVDEGAQPELRLQSTCSEEIALLAPGLHELHFNIPELGPSESCEIELQANFSLPAVADFPAGRSISLEAISWLP